MSDETTNGAAAPEQAQAAGPVFSVEKIYVKDVSFEAPGTPAIFNEALQPELNLNLSQRVQQVNENAFEVVLGVTLTCKAGDKTVYVAEVQQAGVFGLSGFADQGLDAMLGTQCPNVLYPYARQAIGDLIVGGGFPPFYLQPINFDAVYAEGLRQRGLKGAGDGLADAETAGNA